MAPCRRLTQIDVASCSRLLRIPTTTTRPAAVQSQLHVNDQGSTVTRRRGVEGQERGGVLCTDPASAAAAAARALQRCCKQALLQVLAAAWCCCCNRAYHGHQGSDLRGYDALFITNLALVFPVELRLRCWPGGCGDTKTTGCQIGSAGENLEQEKLCVIFPSHLLFCLVADEEDNNEKMRAQIPAGAELTG